MLILTGSAAPIPAIAAAVESARPNEKIWVNADWTHLRNHQPGKGITIIHHVDPRMFDSGNAGSRYMSLLLASRGAQFYSDIHQLPVTFPLGGQKLTVDPEKIVKDAAWAEMRAAYLQSFGVNYIGRTYSDPRNAVLVPFKGDEKHLNDAEVQHLIDNLAEGDWETPWSNTAIISTRNPDNLRDIADALPSTNFLAYSESSKAKLRYIGRDFAEIPYPLQSKRIGIDVRVASRRLKPYEISNEGITLATSF